jgi:hypothetical protein
MATSDNDGTAPEQQATRILGESGIEKRGGYAATQVFDKLPKVDSEPAPGATTGGQPSGEQASQASGNGSQGQSGGS